MNEVEKFAAERETAIERMHKDSDILKRAHDFLIESCRYSYSYNFTWLGRPIIQYPQDIIAMQEIIWKIMPDLIIETGIAHGGSIIFYASMLELIGGDGLAIGIDNDIRAYNRHEIENHRMFKRIRLIEGSSTDEKTVEKVFRLAEGCKKVLVALDSNHTHDHVLKELTIYSPLVNKGSYLVVFDTVIEDLPESFSSDRPWGKGNNPKTAVREFLKSNNRFEIDRQIENKLLLTVSPEGYLKCVED